MEAVSGGKIISKLVLVLARNLQLTGADHARHQLVSAVLLSHQESSSAQRTNGVARRADQSLSRPACSFRRAGRAVVRPVRIGIFRRPAAGVPGRAVVVWGWWRQGHLR